jgi:cell division protein FtsL
MKKSMLLQASVFLAMCVSGGVLMHVSQSVRRAERDLARLDLSIEREKEALRVLDAEWSMLNSPERIEALAKRYLDLDLPDAAQLVSDPKKLEALQAEQEGILIPASLDSGNGATAPVYLPRKPQKHEASSNAPAQGETRE